MRQLDCARAALGSRVLTAPKSLAPTSAAEMDDASTTLPHAFATLSSLELIAHILHALQIAMGTANA